MPEQQAQDQRQQSQETAGGYLPPGPQPIKFTGFSTLNTESSRSAIEDDQMSWCDGFMPIGKNTLRTMPGIGPVVFTSIASTGRSIVSFECCVLTGDEYVISFLSDGSIYATSTTSFITRAIAPAGTILNPTATQTGTTTWGSLYLLIIANQTNGYWMWDGTTFYYPGNAVPGGGNMPVGIRGTALETYGARVWVVDGPNVEFSAPGSFVDFATGDGGGVFTSTDSFLRTSFIQPVQTNGFLYLIADSSINYISNVTTSGTPATTTFTNQNADPEIGTPYADTVDVFSRNIVFANQFGVHVSYGGAVAKVSEALDGIFNSVPGFGGFQLSACKAIVYGKRIWCVLVPVIDPVSGIQATHLLCWDGKRWWSTLQDVQLTYVQHAERSSVINAYGTDGLNIYQLFYQPSTAFPKRAQSKLFSAPGGLYFLKAANRLWGLATVNNLLAATLTVNVESENGTEPAYSFTATNTGPFVFPVMPIAQTGVLIGMTVLTLCGDVELISLDVEVNIINYRG